MSETAAASPGGGGRARFGRLLSDALRRHDLTQQDFGRIVDASQASVSGWVGGRYEPPPAKVFAMERLLGLEPGGLSRPLGYVPVDTDETPSVETAITESTTLDDEGKGLLLAVHRALSRPAEGTVRQFGHAETLVRAAR